MAMDDARPADDVYLLAWAKRDCAYLIEITVIIVAQDEGHDAHLHCALPIILYVGVKAQGLLPGSTQERGAVWMRECTGVGSEVHIRGRACIMRACNATYRKSFLLHSIAVVKGAAVGPCGHCRWANGQCESDGLTSYVGQRLCPGAQREIDSE